jgi:hypothetical protein
MPWTPFSAPNRLSAPRRKLLTAQHRAAISDIPRPPPEATRIANPSAGATNGTIRQYQAAKRNIEAQFVTFIRKVTAGKIRTPLARKKRPTISPFHPAMNCGFSKNSRPNPAGVSESNPCTSRASQHASSSYVQDGPALYGCCKLHRA